jgi:signal transduction histidine kinase
VLAGVTYGVAQSFLTRERASAATTQAFVNARLARSVLRESDPDVASFLRSTGGATSAGTAIRHAGEWYSTSVALSDATLPADLVRLTTQGQAGVQRYRDDQGLLHLAVGIPLPAVDATYIEVFELGDLERTLVLLGRALAIGAAGGMLAATMLGVAAGRRLVAPLRPIADAAERIAGGALGTRLSPATDPDLRRLVDAFNTMAASLQARIDRDARFAADVSHELRSPLAAIAAALHVIDRRRGNLPEHVVLAFDVLAAKVRTFETTVEELLELARSDSAAARLQLEKIAIADLLHQVADLMGAPEVPIAVVADAPQVIAGDRRRLTQALCNLFENADRYAGGVTRVTVEPAANNRVRVAVEDSGPGVPHDEREAIFGRFARGRAGSNAGTASGTGLGLALVEEHIRMHGGRTWVEDAVAGGARFVVELPKDSM